MMTEDAAHKCWCPFVRYSVADSDGFSFTNRLDSSNEIIDKLNKKGPTNNSSRCLGASCMAWRHASSGDQNLGYCGLAGKP